VVGRDIRVIPAELRELPPLRDFEDEAVLSALASRFERQDFGAGQVIAEFGHQADRVYLIAHGKVEKAGTGKYGDASVLGALADGQYFGERVLTESGIIWEFTAKAVMPCTVLSMSRGLSNNGTASGDSGLKTGVTATGRSGVGSRPHR
jgi:CRP-like cAMP-binding protein